MYIIPTLRDPNNGQNPSAESRDPHLRSTHVWWPHIQPQTADWPRRDFIIDDETGDSVSPHRYRELVLGKRSRFHRTDRAHYWSCFESLWTFLRDHRQSPDTRRVSAHGSMKPDCMDITIAKATGSMKRRPRRMPGEANTRQGVHTCVTCSTVKRRTYGQRKRWRCFATRVRNGWARSPLRLVD